MINIVWKVNANVKDSNLERRRLWNLHFSRPHFGEESLATNMSHKFLVFNGVSQRQTILPTTTLQVGSKETLGEVFIVSKAQIQEFQWESLKITNKTKKVKCLDVRVTQHSCCPYRFIAEIALWHENFKCLFKTKGLFGPKIITTLFYPDSSRVLRGSQKPFRREDFFTLQKLVLVWVD